MHGLTHQALLAPSFNSTRCSHARQLLGARAGPLPRHGYSISTWPVEHELQRLSVHGAAQLLTLQRKAGSPVCPVGPVHG